MQLLVHGHYRPPHLMTEAQLFHCHRCQGRSCPCSCGGRGNNRYHTSQSSPGTSSQQLCQGGLSLEDRHGYSRPNIGTPLTSTAHTWSTHCRCSRRACRNRWHSPDGWLLKQSPGCNLQVQQQWRGARRVRLLKLSEWGEPQSMVEKLGRYKVSACIASVGHCRETAINMWVVYPAQEHSRLWC